MIRRGAPHLEQPVMGCRSSVETCIRMALRLVPSCTREPQFDARVLPRWSIRQATRFRPLGDKNKTRPVVVPLYLGSALDCCC